MSSLPKHHSLLIAGLAQAYAAGESPLLSTKALPGLFPSTVPGKTAAQSALESGWIEKVRSEAKGKATITWGTITEQGMAYLLEQTDPKPLLEQVQQRVKREEARLQELQASIRASFEWLQSVNEKVERLEAAIAQRQVVQTRVTVPAWEDRLTDYLATRQSARPAEDCPLPELYREAKAMAPDLSVGTFHDGLRRLHAERKIALQPWTGPLHELPEPSLALLQGHSLAFYASPS